MQDSTSSQNQSCPREEQNATQVAIGVVARVTKTKCFQDYRFGFEMKMFPFPISVALPRFRESSFSEYFIYSRKMDRYLFSGHECEVKHKYSHPAFELD